MCISENLIERAYLPKRCHLDGLAREAGVVGADNGAEVLGGCGRDYVLDICTA